MPKVEEAKQLVAQSQADQSGSTPAPSADLGANEWLVDEMYERYLADKNSVDESWWPVLEQRRTGTPAEATDTVDPFAGSYFVESLTDEVEERAWELMGKVEELGGSVEALEFMQREIEESALSYHERYKSGQDIIVGVNKFVTDQVDDVDILRVDPEAEQRQLTRLRTFKEARDQAGVEEGLDKLRDVARGDGNLLHPIRAALSAGASIGEVCGAMRDVFGEYRGGAFF